MEEIVGKLKEITKSFLKIISKPFLIVCICIILIAAIIYYITLEDASYKKGDKANTPYAVEQRINTVNIDEEGNFITSMTAQELWDQMLEDGSRVNEYLEGPEELQILMNAQMVTDYLDTRPNPDADIDWDALNEDVESGKIQGIIKLKRADSEGNISTLTYVDSETFQYYVDQYNTTGDEGYKELALSHFTVEKEYGTTTSNTTQEETEEETPSEEEEPAEEETEEPEDVPLEEEDEGEEDGEYPPLAWPTNTPASITSYFGPRNTGIEGASTNHQGVDIAGGGATHGSPIYATESGTVIQSEYGHQYNGNWVKLDHGNGYESLYLHCDSLNVSVGDTVAKGQQIATLGQSGIGSGSHLHFAIKLNGGYINPLLFKYEDQSGNAVSHGTGTGGFGSNIDASGATGSSGTSGATTGKFYAKVATWKETNEIIQSNDPLVETTSAEGNPKYSMTITKIDYEPYVSNYRMHFDYLWALLVVSQEKDFVFELADLVYGSEIEITVHDNLSINTSVAVDTYTKTVKAVAEYVNIGVNYDGLVEEEVREIGAFTKELPQTYTTTTTTITKSNTLNISLTKADVWIADYKQEFTYQGPETIPTDSSEDYLEDYPEEADEIDYYDKYGLASEKRQQVHNEYAAAEIYENLSTRVISSKFEYYNKTEGTKTINTTLETKKYVSSPAQTIEKTDKDSEEDNFVTIFIDNKKAMSNIISGADILFEILEKGPNTVDYLDLTKYLLYKATGKDYGVTEYSIKIVDLTSANRVKGNALENYIKLWENAALWKYETGQADNLPSRYLTEDGQNYIVYEDGSAGHNNIAYGIATFITDPDNVRDTHEPYGQGYYNWKSKFEAHGIDVTTFYEGALVDREATTAVFSDILAGFQSSVDNFLAANLPEYEFSQAQRDSLTAVCYQYGNINAFADAYRNSLNADGTVDAEALRRNYSPYNYSSTVNDRKYANWVLFTQEKYINAAGEEVIMGSTLDGWDGDSYSNDFYTFPVYNQYDSRWGSYHYGGPNGSPSANGGTQKTISSSGCACCALAAVLSGYTGEAITPDILTDKLDEVYPGGNYYSPGQGSNSGMLYNNTLLNQYGCSGEAIINNRTAALQALQAGYAVIGGETGHYLAFVPVSSEDAAQGYVFKIIDSARGHDVLCRDFTDADNAVDGNAVIISIIYPHT